MPPFEVAQNWIKYMKENHPNRICGRGSDKKNTRSLVRELPKILKRLKIEFILDVGCGRFTWMAEVLGQYPCEYLGVDVDEEMLEENRSLRMPQAEFALGNLVNFANYTGHKTSAVLARDVFIHDTPQQAITTINSLKNFRYLLTTHYPHGTNTPVPLDVAGWYFAPVNMVELLKRRPILTISENQPGKQLVVYEL